jgi:outer membrane protein assembly factor BamB
MRRRRLTAVVVALCAIGPAVHSEGQPPLAEVATLTSIDSRSGVMNWRARLPFDHVTSLAVADKQVFVAGAKCDGEARPQVIVAELAAATGHVRWRVGVPAERACDTASVTVGRDVVIVGVTLSSDCPASCARLPPGVPVVVGLDRDSGHRVWAAPTTVTSLLAASPSGVVGSGLTDGLVGLDANDGVERWRINFLRPLRATAAGHSVFVAAGTTNTRLMGIDLATGHPLWAKPVNNRGEILSLVVSGVVAVVTGVPRAYFERPARRLLIALDPSTGAERWRRALLGDTLISGAPGLILVSNSKRKRPTLYAHDTRTGETRWTTATAFGPATYAVGDGTTVVVPNTFARQVLAFDAATGDRLWARPFRMLEQERARSQVVEAAGTTYLRELFEAPVVSARRDDTTASSHWMIFGAATAGIVLVAAAIIFFRPRRS